jgi:hypothetical protein
MPGAPVTSGLSANRASWQASGTTITSSCSMAWLQKIASAACRASRPRRGLEPLTLSATSETSAISVPKMNSQFRHKTQSIGLGVQHTVAIQYRKALLLMRRWRVLLEGRRQRGRQAEEVCVHVVALFRK